MAGLNVFDRVIEKIMELLSGSGVITKFSGSRIYGAHLSTITDWALPAISIHVMEGSRRITGSGFLDLIELQIEPWFDASGKNGNVWDDLMECHSAIVDNLHRNGGWDDVLGIKLIEMTIRQEGPQIQDPDGIMHYPSRWLVRATI